MMLKNKQLKNINSDDIKTLLANRHSEDIFIEECKTGPTWSSMDMQKFDAWAMNKSWAHPCVYGYEIKISRQDFLKDEKWRGYLEYCNQFYFVCPPKLISVEELPLDIGLLWTSVNGNCLMTKRKATYRDVSIPECIWRYILMSRTNVKKESWKTDKKAYFQAWLLEKEENRKIGYIVSKKLHQKYERDVEIIAKKQARLELEIENYKTIRQTISDFGFDPDHTPSEWVIKNMLEEIKNGLPRSFNSNVEQTIEGLKKILETINKGASQ